jgi:UDP-2,3-diacylglucosamine pyrophosphatase LpxH
MGKWGNGIQEKVLKPPEKLILLGDILELWDSTNHTLEASTRFLFNTLSETKCDKIYVLGNHDDDLSEILWNEEFQLKRLKPVERDYPIGESYLKPISGLFPETSKPENGKEELNVYKAGEETYLFLHGHEFDGLFTLPSWKWMPHFRDVAQAFGGYTWVFVAILILDVFSILFTGNYNLQSLMILLLLTSISLPFLIIYFGRNIWNSLRTKKYKRKSGLDGFVKWWSHLQGKVNVPENPMNIIYGHTHLTDHVDSPNELNNILNIKEISFNGTLLNIPAWSKDLTLERQEVLQAVFLYIDNEGYKFFGWDWVSFKPFLIPKELIKQRRKNEVVVKNAVIKRQLADIGWPDPLIEEWEKVSDII